MKKEITELILCFDYCLERNCLLCATLVNNRIKELTKDWEHKGKCGQLAEVAVEMIPREEALLRKTSWREKKIT